MSLVNLRIYMFSNGGHLGSSEELDIILNVDHQKTNFAKFE